MNNFEYATTMLSHLYEEGDRDMIFFGQILGMVSYDNDDRLFSKTPEKRLDDAFKLVKYLIQSRDFHVGKTIKKCNETCSLISYGSGFEEFYVDAMKMFLHNGINDVDLNSALWLRKNHIGQPLPVISPVVFDFFAPKN